MPPPALSRQGSAPFPQSRRWLRWLPFLVLLLAGVMDFYVNIDFSDDPGIISFF